MSFKIGNVEINSKIVLAPMAGISNPTYIKLCEEFGLGLAVTELISAEAIVRDNKKTLDMLKGIDKINIPVAVQLFGSNPQTLANAAKRVVELYNVKIIDINMGCPVPKIAVKSQAGSALLKDPDKIYQIIKTVKKNVDVPVTIKIRSGWDENSINAPLVAKLAEKAGASAITIHARTRKEGYSGHSDWNLIKKVKESVSIPVIGNGDVHSCYDAKKMLEETNCDAVMIGRALLGNPWLIKECNDYLENGIIPKNVSYEEKIVMMKKHLNNLVIDSNEKQAVIQIRTHFLYYLKNMPNNAEIKNKICSQTNKNEIIKILDDYLQYLKKA
ncbi:MAG: tRNA dihydrouridine synthase DusB [bacterium]|nr:tRNA dihydrouridine synthase DusB [bacterium]